jgi:hypothetical protein
MMERFLLKENVENTSEPPAKKPFFKVSEHHGDEGKENEDFLTNAAVELEELFPDFDEITEDIAYELPPRLRAKALELIAMRVKPDVKLDPTSTGKRTTVYGHEDFINCSSEI